VYCRDGLSFSHFKFQVAGYAVRQAYRLILCRKIQNPVTRTGMPEYGLIRPSGFWGAYQVQ
jgi:hypothetical protein